MPFSPSNTSRLWVLYTSGGFQHELLFRGPVAGAQSPLTEAAHSVCEAMVPLMDPDDGFLSARFAELGSDISVPVAWTAIFGTGSGGQVPGDSQANFLDFMGRDQTFGARVRWSLYTTSSTAIHPDSNRIPEGVAAPIDAVIDALRAAANAPATVDRICAISKGQPVIYGYVNVAYNSYWQRKQRG